MPKQELIPLTNINPVEVFEGDSTKIEELIALVENSARSLIPDVSTEKGRKAIASTAYNVARSKTAIDDAGKEYASDLKSRIKIIDARRKSARDSLDALRDEVRKPLNDYEAAEAARIEGHTRLINDFMERGNDAANWMDRSLESLRHDMDVLKSTDPSSMEEFEDRAREVISESIEKISVAIDKKRDYEQEQAELEKLRKEAAEREEKERQEAAEKARKEREEQIRREAAEKERRAAEERELRLKKEKQAAIEAKERAEREAIEAKAREKQAAEEAERRAQEELEARKAREKAEQEARERNTRHKGECNRAAADAISEVAKCSPATAKKIVTAIAQGKIPHISIEY